MSVFSDQYWVVRKIEELKPRASNPRKILSAENWKQNADINTDQSEFQCSLRRYKVSEFILKTKYSLENTGKTDNQLSANQAHKGILWMPWHWEAMKDVIGCDKPRGDANFLWSVDFRMGKPADVALSV